MESGYFKKGGILRILERDSEREACLRLINEGAILPNRYNRYIYPKLRSKMDKK